MNRIFYVVEINPATNKHGPLGNGVLSLEINRELQLYCEKGINFIGCLYRPEILWIGADGIMFRGINSQKSNDVIRHWWCMYGTNKTGGVK